MKSFVHHITDKGAFTILFRKVQAGVQIRPFFFEQTDAIINATRNFIDKKGNVDREKKKRIRRGE